MLSILTCLFALPLTVQERRAVSVIETPRTHSELRLALYDVTRLTGQSELERAVLDLESRPTADALLDFEALERRRTQFELQRDGLLKALRVGMQPPACNDTRIEWLPGGRVAVLAEPQQHTWVRTFLARPQAFDGLFDVSTVLWSLPTGTEAVALAARNRERLGADEAQRLAARLQALGAERITAPRVLCFAFAPVELSAGSELPYLADWEFLELTDRQGSVPAPVVQRAFEGFRVHASCYPTLDGNVHVEVELTHTVLERPIESLETTFGGANVPVVVQLPQWSGVEVEGSVDLAAGETLLLAAEDPAAGRVVLALLSARAVGSTESR